MKPERAAESVKVLQLVKDQIKTLAHTAGGGVTSYTGAMGVTKLSKEKGIRLSKLHTYIHKFYLYSAETSSHKVLRSQL